MEHQGKERLTQTGFQPPADFSDSQREELVVNAGELIARANQQMATVHCPESVRRAMDIALDELYTNISLYAYDGKRGPVRCLMDVRRGVAAVTLVDEGIPFDPTAEAEPVLPTDGPKFGGLGIFLARSLMDTMLYERVGNENRLTITKCWKTETPETV